MNKTEQNKRKKYIKEKVKYYQNKMNLNHYKIKVKFPEDDGGSTAMDIGVDIEYLRAFINVYPHTMEEESEGENIDSYLVHELTHIILQPLAERGYVATPEMNMSDFTKTIENATEHLARLII